MEILFGYSSFTSKNYTLESTYGKGGVCRRVP